MVDLVLHASYLAAHMWLFFGLLSALFLGFYDVCKKASLKDNAVLPVLFLATVAAAIPFALFIVLSSFVEPSALGTVYVRSASLRVHALLFIKSLIVASSWICAYFALKHLPLSLGAPIRASQPVFTLMGAIFIFSEHFSLLRWAGVCTALCSYFMLSLAGKKEGVHFLRNGWVLLMVLGTFFGAISSLYDKYLLKQFDPMVVQAYYSLYMVVVLGLVVGSLWWPQRQKYTPFQWRWTIPCIGLLLAAADFFYFQSLAIPGSSIALLTVVRRSNVVVSFGVGSLVFHEKNMRGKALALVGIVAGIVLIGLG